MEERKRNKDRINMQQRKTSRIILNMSNICKIGDYKINKFIKLKIK